MASDESKAEPNVATSRPGWYPDPKDAQRFRHWDGTHWNGLSSSTLLHTDEEEGPGHSGRRFDRRVVLTLCGGVALVAVAVLAALLVSRDDTVATLRSDERAAVGGSAVDSAPQAADKPDPGPGNTGGDEPADDSAEDDGGKDRAGATSAAPTTSLAETPEECVPDDAVLLATVQAYPPLASLAPTLTIADARCVDVWATAVVSSPDTDSALAVYQRDGDAWSVLRVGAEDPCSGLGIRPESEALLGCDAF
ncbi:hypothetical protein BH10ACT3_BH10ACT3_02160 [soil metagenome]